jgi:hypothetical protein
MISVLIRSQLTSPQFLTSLFAYPESLTEKEVE